MNKMLQQIKIIELESLRGLAAVLIVFFHMPKWSPLLDIAIINNSYLMVDLFFVISGFVIFNSYAARINSGRDLYRFQFLRFWRVYPLHIFFLFFFLAIEIAKYIAANNFGIRSPNSSPFDLNNVSSLIENIFLIQSIIPNNPLTFNHPSWSISVEFYTYLIFGLVILLFKKYSTVLFAGLTFLSITMLTTDLTYGFSYLLRCFSGFFWGCLIAGFFRKNYITIPAYFSTIVLTLMTLFLIMKPYQSYDVLIYLLSGLFILCLVMKNNDRDPVKRLLRSRVLTWLGKISFSVYMVQATVIWLVNQIVRFASNHESVDAYGKSVPVLSSFFTVLTSVIVLSLILVLGNFFYELIEKPYREKSRKCALENLN